MPDVPFHAALAVKVGELTALFTLSARGGFNLREIITFIITALEALTTLARAYDSMPDREKKRQILSALKLMYMSKDPDLPWIPAFIEPMVESLLFDVLAPELYDWIAARTHTSADGVLASPAAVVTIPTGAGAVRVAVEAVTP